MVVSWVAELEHGLVELLVVLMVELLVRMLVVMKGKHLVEKWGWWLAE